MKVDWPYSEIGQKMANGQLLFCTLLTIFHFTSILPKWHHSFYNQLYFEKQKLIGYTMLYVYVCRHAQCSIENFITFITNDVTSYVRSSS